MNPSATIPLDESPRQSLSRRAPLRGVPSPQSPPSPLSPEYAGAPFVSPYSALIDAKLKCDRQIQRLTARVQELAALLAVAQERARQSLAQDLHDNTGTALTVANLALGRAEHWLPDDAPAALGDALHQARAALADVCDTSHRIVEGLQTPSFETRFADTLAVWIGNFGARTAIPVDFSCPDDARLERMSHDMSLALFRVMQEALGNVARHAQAARASVIVSTDGQGVTMTIEDDGVGISARARRKSGRFGLSGMRARCEALCGSLRVAAAKPAGTSVRARLPWTAARPGLFALSVVNA